MPRRLAPLLLLGGGLLLLVSLYLPWQSDPLRAVGWTEDTGSATALFALLLVAVAGAAVVRPQLADRLPLGLCGLLAGYFGLATGATVRALEDRNSRGFYDPDVETVFGYGGAGNYGSYVALAGLLLLLLAAVALSTGRPGLRPATRIAALALATAFAIVLLLPWLHVVPELSGAYVPGVALPPGSVAAALALCLLALWWRNDRAETGDRLGLGLAVVVFACGAASGLPVMTRAPAAWIGIGIALALTLVAAPAVARGRRPQFPAPLVLATLGAAGLLAGSLFMPWQTTCVGANFGPLSNRCLTAHGWGLSSSTAVLLALALAVVLVDRSRLPLSVVELSAGVALMLVNMALAARTGLRADPLGELGYGAVVGLAAGALMVVLALATVRLHRPDWSRLPARILPIAGVTVYLAIVVVPWWDVLSIEQRFEVQFGPYSWLTIAGALLGIRLLCAWARRVGSDSATGELVLLPCALLALASLDLIHQRSADLPWGGWIVLGLCPLLALLGHVEREGGVNQVRIPEALRVDRL